MDNFEVYFAPAKAFLLQAVELLPRLLLALLVLVVGWLVAKAVRYAAVRALRAVNFHVVTERSGLDGFLHDGGVQSDTTQLFAGLLYFLVIVAALVMAFNMLGLTYITDLLGRVVLFVPKVIVALLILVFGAYFGRFVGSAIAAYCRHVRIQDADLLGRLAQYAIVTFVVLIALDQLNIGGDIVRQSFLIILAGLVFALALAFGLGGREWAAELLERWWPRRRKP